MNHHERLLFHNLNLDYPKGFDYEAQTNYTLNKVMNEFISEFINSFEDTTFVVNYTDDTFGLITYNILLTIQSCYDIEFYWDDKKYLNDEVYIKSFINDKINLSNIGPYKIKLELMSDFKEEKIEEELSKISEEIWIEKIKKIISKKEKLNNKLSAVALKKKIKNDLINLGYDIKLIDSYLVINEEDDYEIIKKEFIKQYMKHKKKGYLLFSPLFLNCNTIGVPLKSIFSLILFSKYLS